MDHDEGGGEQEEEEEDPGWFPVPVRHFFLRPADVILRHSRTLAIHNE